MRTKEKVDKKDGYLAFHLIQSFSPGEVDYETAHKIGIELADKVFKGRFQYVIATHIDTQTPYEQSNNAINRRFCYTKQMTASITF